MNEDTECSNCGGVGCVHCDARHLPSEETGVERWADVAQFHAEGFDQLQEQLEKFGVAPKVHLIWMTPDPLGALASFNEMYIGNVIRGMDDVTDEMRRKALDDMQKTHLQAPLENIKVQFLIEGVDRAFTHQHVRQRTAVFAQESMRFAIPGKLLDATTLPPPLHGSERTLHPEEIRNVALDAMLDSHEYAMLSRKEKQRARWDYCVQIIDEVYHSLVNDEFPGEDARGLLPHCTATRIHFTTDLRNLIAHSGMRLCTQAQFHWRSVFYQIVEQIRQQQGQVTPHLDGDHGYYDAWQYEAIADAKMFKPICFQTGKCEFNGSADRACSIRDRVNAFSQAGIPSSEWGRANNPLFAMDDPERGPDHPAAKIVIPAIRTEEWLQNPAAARTTIPKGV